MCRWSANLEFKWLAVFCSLKETAARHFIIRNFIQLAYNWRFRHYIRAVHNANSLDVAFRNFDVACRHFGCGMRHFEVSFDRLFFFLLKRLGNVLVLKDSMWTWRFSSHVV